MTVPTPVASAEQALESLHNEAAFLWKRWHLWKSLFDYAGFEEDQRAMRAATLRMDGEFFTHMQRALADYVVMALARLADPAEVSGRKNLTLRWVLDQITPWQSMTPKAEIEAKVTAFERLAKDAVSDYRNKVIGHNDRDVSLDGDWSRIRTPRISTLDAAMEPVPAIITTMYEGSTGEGYSFDVSFPSGTFMPRILGLLEDAMVWREVQIRERQLSDQELRTIVKRGQWTYSRKLPHDHFGSVKRLIGVTSEIAGAAT